MKIMKIRPSKQVLCAALVLVVVSGLTGCGSKEKKSGQALASVNGEEITVMQLNEELQRSGVQSAQQEVARKQLLEALIDRQLLQNEAARDKTDRDPNVVQAIERAKAQIIAQAYIQKKLGTMAKPSKAEVEDYFQKHPELFIQRKQFDMRQLVIASKDLDEPLKKAMDDARSIDEVAAWLDVHKVKFVRNEVSRTTADLPAEMGAKLQSMSKGQLFIIKEGERSMLIGLANVKEAPVGLDAAAPQIEQFLGNAKSNAAATTELARLRGAAKIEYLNKTAADKNQAGSAVAAASIEGNASAAASSKPAASTPSTSQSNERGIAGLRY